MEKLYRFKIPDDRLEELRHIQGLNQYRGDLVIIKCELEAGMVLIGQSKRASQAVPKSWLTLITDPFILHMFFSLEKYSEETYSQSWESCKTTYDLGKKIGGKEIYQNDLASLNTRMRINLIELKEQENILSSFGETTSYELFSKHTNLIIIIKAKISLLSEMTKSVMTKLEDYADKKDEV